MQRRKTILTTTCALLALLAAVVGCTPRPKGTLTIANLAGVHFARAAEGDGAVLAEDAEKLLTDAVAEFNATKELDFVVLSGNLLQAPRPANLDRMKEILDGLRVPYFIVLGNTDMASGPADAEAQAAVSRSTILWTFQGHGVSGPEGYWAH
ncbi:MAG: hypothetical protein QF662_07230, partial [Phycisphaerae bacterium]|nr:hypothetical protein [Phycisphaerae bacterium]